MTASTGRNDAVGQERRRNVHRQAASSTAVRHSTQHGPSLFQRPPARRVDAKAKTVEHAYYEVAHHVLQTLRMRMEGWHRRHDSHAHPGELQHVLKVYLVQTVSHAPPRRGDGSPSDTSAARQSKLSPLPLASAPSVRALHGATTMPVVRKEPLAIAAIMSRSP